LDSRPQLSAPLSAGCWGTPHAYGSRCPIIARTLLALYGRPLPHN